MEPSEYTGKEWQDLLREMDGRTLKNTIKGAYRKVARRARQVAVNNLTSSKLKVKGDTSDWKKGIRAWVYNKGSGFLLTVNPHRNKDAGFHKNRRYGKSITRGPRQGNINQRKLPVLMWAEDGTQERNRGTRNGKTSFFRISRITGKRYRNYHRNGTATGKMPAYNFLQKSEAEARAIVERDLHKELEAAAIKAARKAGMI